MKSSIAYVSPHGVRDSGIEVGSEQWFTWLESQTSFRYESSDGSFTARRYGNYWNAYRKRFGKLRQEYLGKTDDLTLVKLTLVAKLLETDDLYYWKLKSEQKKSKAKTKKDASHSHDPAPETKQQPSVNSEDKIQSAIAILEDSLKLYSDEVDEIKQKIRYALYLLR